MVGRPAGGPQGCRDPLASVTGRLSSLSSRPKLSRGGKRGSLEQWIWLSGLVPSKLPRAKAPQLINPRIERVETVRNADPLQAPRFREVPSEPNIRSAWYWNTQHPAGLRRVVVQQIPVPPALG